MVPQEERVDIGATKSQAIINVEVIIRDDLSNVDDEK
jgi:hypothetical protein